MQYLVYEVLMRADSLYYGKRLSVGSQFYHVLTRALMYVKSLNSKSSTVFLCVSKAVNTYFKCDHVFFATVFL